MITKDEIKKLTKQSGFGDKTLPIERDFMLDIILYEISQTSFSKILVFKGGTSLKKIFFSKEFDSYRFSKDLDFNIIKEVSLNSINLFIKELCERISTEHGLNFKIMGGLEPGDYGEYSYSIKIKLQNRGFIFDENVRIKFDFAIRPKFDKEYKIFDVPNHYPQFFDKNITVQSETLESIFYGKMLALFGDEYRTAPKDLFDVVNIIEKLCYNNVLIKKGFEQFNTELGEIRLSKIRKLWKDFFSDQLPYVPSCEEYISKFLKYNEMFIKK